MIFASLIGAFLLSGCTKQESSDQIGPYINLTNYEFHTVIGSPVDFSHISGYDDVDGMVQVYVIDDADYDTAGTYYPVLTAKDMTGNVTEVPITVVVDEVSYVENEEVETITKQPEKEMGCDARTAEDPNEDCDTVLDLNIEEYLILYEGQSSKIRCEKEAIKINGSCVVIVTNDGHFWGYGLSIQPEENSEEDIIEKES